MKLTPLQLTSEQKKYALRTLLEGQDGAVACVAAHPLGMHIATGGDDGTRIWHLASSTLLSFLIGAGEHGTTTAIAWIIRPDDTDNSLAFVEKMTGYFTEVFCNRGQDGQDVSGLAHDPNSVIHQFIVNASMMPHIVKSVAVPQHWPQAVAFRHTGVRGLEIWNFGRDDGIIHVLSNNGKILQLRTTGSVIGHAMINTKDNVTQGDISDTIHIGFKDCVQSVTTVEVAGVPLVVIG
ncbi:hypothetical protein BT96DRAFT_998718 [Gymnopus androsaceus JB14]|uniref:WD40 repeat-like protein n=1 Tax=Gymnopus androsaceus JB14 TaxID=1447944 RepID=A0A6A4H7W7_9AGAR|nr:hypothetical protein BT96DRAFT_998718 [Gymnopus androsaceus JB14]